MTDRAELDVVVSSQVDRLLSGMSSMERSLATIERAHGTAATAATQQASSLTNLEGRVGSVTGTIGKLAGVFTGLFVAFEAIKHGFEAFDSLEKHNIDLLRTTEILGGNGQAASAWSVIAGEMGLSLDMLDRGFTKLSTDMSLSLKSSLGVVALREMGIAASDTTGKLRPLNDVINDAADYFHKHAGAANNAALANQLFGRSGFELLPILEQGRVGIAAITDEARKYGLILDSATIERNAAFTFQLKEAQLAGEGLAVSVGNALLPGIAALGQAFSKVVSDNLPAFIAGINRAVSYVIGFVEGLTGMKMAVGEGSMALSNLGNISGDTGTGLSKAAGSSNALADAIAKVRDRTKDTTDAIDRQIASLNSQQAAEHFMEQQAKLQQDLANKGQDIDKLRQQQYQQFWLGNFAAAQTVGDQITQDQQDQANLQNQITQGSQDQQTKAKVTALEAQKKHVADASNAQIAAMQKAARGTTEAMAGAAAGMGPLFSKAGQEAAGKFKFAMDSGAEATGNSMAGKLMDAVFGPLHAIGDSRHGAFVRSGGQGFLAIGTAIGDSIGMGISTAIGKKLSDYFGAIAKKSVGLAPIDSGHLFTELKGIFGIRSYDRGGMVPGSIGAPRLVIAHGGEEIRTPAQQGDSSETNRLLRQLIAATLAGNGAGSSGGLAALSALINDASRSRARGITGTFT
jgi:hypothetical protein